MESNALLDALQGALGTYLPSILGALVILAVGWLLAVAIRAATRRLLSHFRLNERLQAATGQAMNVERGIAVVFFALVMLITVVAMFNALDLENVSGPFATLLGQFTAYLPHFLAGAVLALVAWVVATLVRALVTRVLGATRLDERLSAEADMAPMSQNAGNVLYWLVILLFLPPILSAFQLRGLMEPVQGMLDRMLGFLPNLVAALLIGFVGWLVANVLRGLVNNLLAAAGVDRFAVRLGFGEEFKLSRLAAMVVFILVFVPSLIAALDALQVEAISAPATAMLQQFFDAVPRILAAALILALTWYVGRFAAGLLARLLAGVGFDALPARLGMTQAFSGGVTASVVAGRVALFFAMLFATVEAANQLGFEQVGDIVAMFIRFGGDVLIGGVILVIGFWLAGVAADAIERTSGTPRSGLARIARFAILGLVIAMGLRAMGIADDIVNLAFGLTLGAVAIAVALSFGLGGREAAGRQMEHWLAQLRKEERPRG